ncbi:MAG: hypothetical protein ACC651_10915, partial [Candidatus Scalindua sp.]
QATQAMGLMGAVLAWLLRILGNTLLMFFFALAAMKRSVRQALNWRRVVVALLIITSFAGMFLQSPSDRLLILAVSIIMTYLFFWFLIISKEDRMGLLKRIGYAAD